MNAMDVDPLDLVAFTLKYGRNYPNATSKVATAAYARYKEFYVKYYSNHPAAITDCYDEYLATLGKQCKQHTFIGRIEEQRGEEFEYCYWFCAILQEVEAVGHYP